FNRMPLLLRALALSARQRTAPFLVACSSLTSQDAGEGMAMYQDLRAKFLVRLEWRTNPHPELRCAAASGASTGRPPRLMRAYLGLGARICGPPALDRQFGTIDFLTLLDLHSLPAVVRAHFFG